MNYSTTGNVASEGSVLNSNVTITVDSGSNIDLANYLSFALATVDSTVELIPLLVESKTDTIGKSKLDNITENKTYYIAYARNKSGQGAEAGFEIVEVLSYTFTINVNEPVEAV